MSKQLEIKMFSNDQKDGLGKRNHFKVPDVTRKINYMILNCSLEIIVTTEKL